jgi:hypothetical protein
LTAFTITDPAKTPAIDPTTRPATSDVHTGRGPAQVRDEPAEPAPATPGPDLVGNPAHEQHREHQSQEGGPSRGNQKERLEGHADRVRIRRNG